MKTEILKSKFLHFAFFRFLVDHIFGYDETLRLQDSRVRDLESSYKNLLDINKNLIDALEEQSAELKDLTSVVDSLKLEPINQKPTDLARTPSRIMDRIRDEYNADQGTE